MFSKAKLKRFNEEVGCAPPPTKYDPRIDGKPVGVALEKSERFKETKEHTPAPNAYCGLNDLHSTPRKGAVSMSKLNLSAASTSSSHSQKEFLSPRNFTRSKSLKFVRSKDSKQLIAKIDELTTERNEMQKSVKKLEEKISSLEKCHKISPNVEDNNKNDNCTEYHLKDGEIVVKKKDYELMKEEIAHLVMLRDNMELSITRKDDIIADLQMQLDLIVGESQQNDKSYEHLRDKISELSLKLDKTVAEKKHAESKVSELIRKHENMITQQNEELHNTKEQLTQKDIEIELLNDSISTLNTKMSTMAYASDTQVSALDLTVNSTSSKEQLQPDDLINQIKEVTIEDKSLLTLLNEEKEKSKRLCDAYDTLNMKCKENNVIQQFLEKEIKVREDEISNNLWKISDLTSQLESTTRLVGNLQEEAEMQLNQLFCLKATLSAKEYDIEAKDDLISSLVQNKDKLDTQDAGTSTLEIEINNIKEILLSGKENASQMEERVIELLREVDERESQYKQQLQLKDSELEEISLKYSDALLQQDTLKRIVTVTTEQHESDSLIIQALNMNINNLQSELSERETLCKQFEKNLKELTVKITHLEDALACEEENAQYLEVEIKTLKNSLKESNNEMKVLKSTNDGFVSQITQLRIDMTKKCCAVEEMQQCIDTLRDEKTSQTQTLNQMKDDYTEKETLLTDLQEEFETKLKTISELQENLQQKERVINDQSKDNESINRRLNDVMIEKDNFEQRLYDKNCEFDTIEAERKTLQQTLWDQETQVNEALVRANDELTELKSQLEVTNQESGKEIYDLELKLKSIEQKYTSAQQEINELKESLGREQAKLEESEKNISEMDVTIGLQHLERINVQTQYDELLENHEKYKEYIKNHENDMLQYNHEMLRKDDQIHEQVKLIAEKDQEISVLQTQTAKLENDLKSANNQSAVMEELNKDIEKKTVEIDRLISSLMDLERALVSIKASSRTRERELQVINMQLLEESDSWKKKFVYLEKMIEPFREQLDTYDMERAALISKNAAAKKQIDELSKDYAKLIGHTNHKQKIQHMVKLKDQNSNLKEEVQELRYEVEQLKHQRKTEKYTVRPKAHAQPTDRENKENESYSPLKSNKVNRI